MKRCCLKIATSELNMAQKESQNILDINHFLNLRISKEKELMEIAGFAAEISDGNFAVITILNNGKLYTYSNKVSGDHLFNTEPFCKQALAQFEVLVINNASEEISFYAGVPLTTPDGINIGTICVYDQAPKTLSGIQRKMLQSLARQVINMLEFDASLHLLKDEFTAAEDAEVKLRSFFESSRSCHLLVDKDFRIVSYNTSFAELMLNNTNQIIAEGMIIEDCIHPQLLTDFKAHCAEALLGKASAKERWLGEGDGKLYWYLSYKPAYHSDGSIAGVSFTATDMTKSIENQQEALQQAESLERIAHIQAHELLACIGTINEVMDVIRQTGKVNSIHELQLLGHSVKELGRKSIMVNYGS